MAKVVGKRQCSDHLCLQLISHQTMKSHMEKTIHHLEILDGTRMCLLGRRGVYSPCGKKGEMDIAPKTPGGWTAAETASWLLKHSTSSWPHSWTTFPSLPSCVGGQMTGQSLMETEQNDNHPFQAWSVKSPNVPSSDTCSFQLGTANRTRWSWKSCVGNGWGTDGYSLGL